MANYTNQAKIEAELNRKLSDDEQTNLPLVLAVVDKFINNQLSSSGDATFNDDAVTTRYYDGGSEFVDIDPVISNDSNSITVKYVDKDFEDDSEVEENEYILWPENGEVKTSLRKRRGCFRRGVSNIAVTGKFSLGAAAPKDIQYLATYVATILIRNSSQISEVGNLKSESIEGYSRTFASLEIEKDPIVINILSMYRNDEVLI